MKTIYHFMGLLAIFAVPSLGQDYCSLAVQVTGTGVGIRGAFVQVEEPDGSVQTEFTQDGVARFCGLGVRPVTIRVGRGCAPVTLTGVPLVWGVTRNVRVIYDDNPCREDRLMIVGGPICSLLLRFRDNQEKGKPSSQVALDPLPPRSAELRSDASGRIMVTLRKDEAIHAFAKSPGFMAEPIDFECRGFWEGERIIVLKRDN